MRITSPDQLELFDPAAWVQHWLHGEPQWRPPDEGGFDARRYRVVPIDRRAALGFVETHHYSRSYPAARRRYGMVEAVGAVERLVGVAVLGQPMHRQVTARAFPRLGSAAAELSRFVLLDDVPANAETWLLARVHRLAAEDGLRGVVAFSDPMPRIIRGGCRIVMPGHLGRIYMLKGRDEQTFRYTGRGTKRLVTFLPDGRVFSDRTRAKITGWERGGAAAARMLIGLGAVWPPGGLDWFTTTSPAARASWVRDALAAAGATRARHRGNHRYIWAIGDRGARRRISLGLESEPFPTCLDPAVWL